MAPEMDGSKPKLDCREIIALANRRETERLANEIQKNTERLASNIKETGELKEDTASSIEKLEKLEKIVSSFDGQTDGEKEADDDIRKNLQVIEDMKAEQSLSKEIPPSNPFKRKPLVPSILREVAERPEGDPPKKSEDSDKLDRLEILVNNLTSMFRTVFGDHALISGHWVDLTGGVDVALMRDKAGYDRSGNLKLGVPAKGEG